MSSRKTDSDAPDHVDVFILFDAPHVLPAGVTPGVGRYAGKCRGIVVRASCTPLLPPVVVAVEMADRSRRWFGANPMQDSLRVCADQVKVPLVTVFEPRSKFAHSVTEAKRVVRAVNEGKSLQGERTEAGWTDKGEFIGQAEAAKRYFKRGAALAQRTSTS